MDMKYKYINLNVNIDRKIVYIININKRINLFEELANYLAYSMAAGSPLGENPPGSAGSQGVRMRDDG